jgi:hypothetical protein
MNQRSHPFTYRVRTRNRLARPASNSLGARKNEVPQPLRDRETWWRLRPRNRYFPSPRVDG